jgi:hypothetical protein
VSPYFDKRGEGTGGLMEGAIHLDLSLEIWSGSQRNSKLVRYGPLNPVFRCHQHFMPNRLSMMCSRRNCSYWRHCEREWGGEVPES